MISRENYKSVRIHIITFKDNVQTVQQHIEKMNEERRQETDGNKFICSICLNSNKFAKDIIIEDDRKHTKFSNKHDLCLEKPRARIKYDDSLEGISKEIKSKAVCKTKTIAVQTLETDCSKNINLLNEVLTVFQNKKQSSKQKSNTIILKDVSISTEDIHYLIKPRLQVSKVFQFSTDEPLLDRNDKSTIITSHEDILRSQFSIGLPKHKSLSIPQMKSEETRHSSKGKTKSKDVIEEVNRMFGNVKRRPDASDSNRPVVRSGPRILPVVKTDKPVDSVDRIWSPCKCKSGDLSSGDSFVRPEYCHKEKEHTDKCVYMMCCLKNCHKMPTGVMYCRCCGEDFRYNRNKAESND